MNYQLLKDLLLLVESFDQKAEPAFYTKDIQGFKNWIAADQAIEREPRTEPDWEGKENGRTPESAISTLLVHLNRYAKTYSKAAIHGSGFSTQEDFIYLITLKSFGSMTKMELIKRNIHDKPTGMQIINRLIKKGWVVQGKSVHDKRSRIISLTPAGTGALESQMDNIRMATRIVSGNLSYAEKMELIRLLHKLDDFHQPIFLQHIDSAELLSKASIIYSQASTLSS